MTNSCSTKTNKVHTGPFTRPAIILIAAIFQIILLFPSCDDNPSDIGIEILPQKDFVTVVSSDTVTVKAYTMYVDSVNTAGSDYMVAGSLYDPYFGTTTSDFVTQLRLITQWGNYNYTIDSVFFKFLPSSVSGDTAGLHYLRLYETGTRLIDTLDYYSNADPDTIKFLGEYRLPLLKADSSYSVRIDNWVGEYLLRDTTKYLPATEFYTDYFKGLYVGVKSLSGPVLFSMSAASTSLAITIHFHDTENKTYSYSYVATERAVNYNRTSHDFSTAEPGKRMNHINDMVTDTAVFLQGYNGVFARFDFPYLASLRSVGNLAVNQARLYVPVLLDGDKYIEKNLPMRIYMRYRDAEGVLHAVPDLVHDASFHDGTYYMAKDYYIFNIPTFIQQYLDGEITDASVEMYYPSPTDKNVIFRANSNSPTVKFEFAYSLY